jgi:hypothetical protein
MMVTFFYLWSNCFEYYHAGIRFGSNYFRVKLIPPMVERFGKLDFSQNHSLKFNFEKIEINGPAKPLGICKCQSSLTVGDYFEFPPFLHFSFSKMIATWR